MPRKWLRAAPASVQLIDLLLAPVQRSLLYLDVSSNNLTGNIPECLFEGNSTMAVLHLGEDSHVSTCADQSVAASCVSLLAPLQLHCTAVCTCGSFTHCGRPGVDHAVPASSISSDCCSRQQHVPFGRNPAVV